MDPEKKPPPDCRDYQDELKTSVAKKAQRKMKARRNASRSIWYGLGMFGLVGWSVAIPVLIGIVVGIWIDRTWKPCFSCTLTCLFIGVVVGCSIAWYWIKQEGLVENDGDDHPPQDVAETPQREDTA